MPTKDLGVSEFPVTASLIFLNGCNYIAICTFPKIVILSNTPLSSGLVFIFGIILYILTYFFLAVYARIFQQRILWKKNQNLFIRLDSVTLDVSVKLKLSSSRSQKTCSHQQNFYDVIQFCGGESFLVLQFCELVQIAPQYNLYITTWNCVEIFFSIWVFFHKHSRFTGQQGKGEGISLTLLYPRACRQGGVRCVTPPLPLPPPLFWNLSVLWQNVSVKFPDPIMSVNLQDSINI